MTEQNTTKSDSFAVEPDELDRVIALKLIENPSITDESLGQMIGLGRQATNRRRHGSGVKSLMSEIMAIPKNTVRRIVAKALSRLEVLIDDQDSRIALTASLGVLKWGTDLRDELVGSQGNLLDMTDLERSLRSIELETEFDRVESKHKIAHNDDWAIIKRGLEK